MESVLKKTVASLETALRYNPNNIELMTSLAEGYVRMGRLDSTTLAFCEKVLAKYPDNALLMLAQTAAFVLEQTDDLENSINKLQTLPPPETIETAMSILEGFLAEVAECVPALSAYVRVALLGARVDEALDGLRRLLRFPDGDFTGVRRVLDWVNRRQNPERIDWLKVFDIYNLLDDQKSGIKALERIFDKNVAKDSIGPILLKDYLSRFTAANPEEAPEAIRPRFLQLLLDYGDSQITEEWLRKATLFGWQLSDHSKAYAHSLIQDEQLETAFEILQRMPLDDDVREMLNEIAAHYEQLDDVDDAVRILQYINNHEINDHATIANQEKEFTRTTELSLAELQLKNGRFSEALAKFISALCLGSGDDRVVMAKVDELLAQGVDCDPASLLRLAGRFRDQKDYPRSLQTLNRLIAMAPNHPEALREMETLFNEVLEANPDSPPLRLERGMLQRRLGRWDEAIVDFKIAQTDPALEDQAHRMLALTYREAGHYREALSRFQSFNVETQDYEPLYLLHMDFMRNEDFRSALQTLDLINARHSTFRDVKERIRQLQERTSRSVPQSGQSGGNSNREGGSESENRMREIIGDMAIGRYRMIEKIGSGGMGVVHKVFDVRQNKIVAMKILREGLASSSKALDRFFREARIAAQVQHRNIVNIYDYNISSQDGQNYIVMEFVDGQSMREFIDLHFDNTISTSMEYITEMLYYTVQLFDALYATHAKGIIHRDIKPDNVMITAAGLVKITDFGIVHVEEATFTPTGAMLGTPRYMSPEQVTGARVDGRSDIYSVGVMLYEVLTGSPPFMTGDISYQQVNKAAVEPRLLNSAIPQSINNFILKCLEKKPENRYQDAQQAKAILAEILQSLGGCSKFQNPTIEGTMADPPRDAKPKTPKPISPPPEAVSDLDLDMDMILAAPPSRGDAGGGPGAKGSTDIDALELEDLDLDVPE